MDNCFLIVNKIAKNRAKDHISLSYDERFLRRKKLVSDNGFEFLVNLPETKSLSENQAFRLQSGNLILIKNKKESLLEIKGKNLMQLIWHIGNRHMPCQIEKDRIFIQYDEVIKKMILKLGGKVKKVLRPFKPEGGAYGIGRTHSHKH
jgi:urease accessory protein